MKIASARRLQGSVEVPGDKSISHRAALIAALADGASTLENFSSSQDCASTLSCLSELGVEIEREGTSVGVVGSGFRRPAGPLDCGNSGSTMRMLAGLLATQSFECALVGDDSLSARPMGRIVEPLAKMGAEVRTKDGHAPLHIRGASSLRAIDYVMPVASAQVKTSLLLAGLRAQGRTVIREPHARTRDHTERMLRWFGVSVETIDEPDTAITALSGPVRLEATNVRIPGDFSSAAYLISAAAMIPASELEIRGVGLNPTRTRLLDVLRSLGSNIETIETGEECNEPRGTVRVRGNSLKQPASNLVRGELAAALIDELPLLAVVGTQVPGGLVLRDAGELRVKETDRIAATVKNLKAMGAEVEEFEDGLAVNGPVRLKGAIIDLYGDHRIAMAFSVAALIADGDSEMIGSECVAISFPDFFARLEWIVER